MCYFGCQSFCLFVYDSNIFLFHQTAYFVIPENVRHGEELICSYFACRNAGIKFRYCSHCKVPVAKRNFRKRHKHGGEEIAKIPGEDSDGEEEIAVKKGIPSQITANHKEAVEADGISSQSTDSNPREKADDMHKGLVRTVQTFESSKNHAVLPVAAALDEAKISGERQKRWMDLLSKRPSTKDGDAMSTWLMEVLAISDLETPLKGSEGEGVAKKPRADSLGSDGYGSSNDDSDKKAKAKSPPGAVVKKKRPAEEEEGQDGFVVSGSFAAWKERKKQKKQQAKMAPTTTTSTKPEES